MKKYLAVDVGGTALKYSLMTEEAEILEKGEVPTPKGELNLFVDTLCDLYRKYEGQVEALVMSAPGKIDANRGYFYTSGALKYIDQTDLAAILKERIPVPFAVENDAKAAALAELWKGSMQGIQEGSVIVLGTGIGGAVIINGKLHRGYTFAAGEYSNIATDWRKPVEPHTAWYSLASTSALIKMYAKKKNMDPAELNGRIFFKNVNDGEPEAAEVLDDFAYYVASGIYSLQIILDCQRFAIGGGISKQPVLLERINYMLDQIFEAKQPCTMSKPEVVVCTFGNDANMIGALYHYLFELKN